MQHAGVPERVFNRPAFRALTLDDAKLQADLLTSFLRDVDQLRLALDSATREGQDEELFGEVVHRLRGVSHFLGADRLGLILRAVEESGPMPELDRQRAALSIVRELTALEAVIHEELARHGSCSDRTATLPSCVERVL